jgi:EAL domain-containing protein (putative c-di-GMP-specific phosphodiesterase class I)
MRVSWEHQIRDALDNDGFELYCQPIVDLATGATTQAELLLRLHTSDGVILPGVFLGAAERSGLIHAVDRWVIAKSIAAAAEHPGLKFEINLSGRTTDDELLPDFVAEQLVAHGADPSSIVFELTETAAIGNIGRARELARSLADIGCTFAIDDFGAGFSTFYYLKHFPALYLKIDGDFVRSPRSRTDELVIDSIVRIARDLGKKTIAEFVSDEATLRRMRELGVDYAQGFHIARPFPLADL